MHKTGLVRALAVGVCITMAAATAGAAVTLHPLFTDHAVLQRGMRVPVWGKAAPGEEVTVQLANRKGRAVADENGDWIVRLRSLKTGGPYEMVATGDGGSITVHDVLIGEVWVCSGQSNMAWPVSRTLNAEQEIAAADLPGMHLFTVPRKTAETPQDTVEAAWGLCTPETVPDFSAAAFYFGRELHRELGVPIGLIHTSWGGTPSEAWTRLGWLAEMAEVEPLLARWDKVLAEYPQALEAYNKRVKEWQAAAEKAKAEGKSAPPKPRGPLGPSSPRRPGSLYNGMLVPLMPYAIRGAIWYQGEANAGRAYQYRTLFPAMIENWREDWGQGAFPFLFVQLANWQAVEPEPGPAPWAELREAQTMTLSLKNTGMAVAIDIGEVESIHPMNKQDVGKRLALAALAGTYGRRLPYSGP
ncbi:MAG: sialate O-acetylesterase, partial [Candidatus Hydrogenedentes bacterium]|nr:sialate O-acetylesterase [Candidatus Hydrogenedentota bacterium]